MKVLKFSATCAYNADGYFEAKNFAQDMRRMPGCLATELHQVPAQTALPPRRAIRVVGYFDPAEMEHGQEPPPLPGLKMEICQVSGEMFARFSYSTTQIYFSADFVE